LTAIAQITDRPTGKTWWPKAYIQAGTLPTLAKVNIFKWFIASCSILGQFPLSF
jgi:hypothetical protein